MNTMSQCRGPRLRKPDASWLCVRTRDLRNPMERSTRNAALQHPPGVFTTGTRVTATWRPHTAKHPIAKCLSRVTVFIGSI